MQPPKDTLDRVVDGSRFALQCGMERGQIAGNCGIDRATRCEGVIEQQVSTERAPAGVRAQVWAKPVARAAMPLSRPLTDHC